MEVQVNIPTKIHLTEQQQHDIAKKFILEKVFQHHYDSLPYYHKDLKCFVACDEGHCGTRWYKVADGDDKEFAAMLSALNSLVTLNRQNAPLVKSYHEEITNTIGNVTGKLSRTI